MNKRLCTLWISLVMTLCLVTGCVMPPVEEETSQPDLTLIEAESSNQRDEEAPSGQTEEGAQAGETAASQDEAAGEAAASQTESEEPAASQDGETEGDGVYVSPETYEDFNADTIPAFAGKTYAVIHDNVPYFTEEEIREALEGPYEDYSPLDDLGRCGRAMASLGVSLMPQGSRGDISQIHPSGWQRGCGYERSHLIAFQLAGENDNQQNLVTGTHFFNNDGMRPFEEMVGDYVREFQALVLYRVTPVFSGDELVCRGALMEAWSLEDEGEDICYCIFVYNVFDPSEHTLIDYRTGRTYEGELQIAEEGMAGGIVQSEKEPGEIHTYIVNKRSLIFHYPDCEGVEKMSDKNKMEFTGTRDDALDAGYQPCPACNP